ncbi:MAG: T9SS type A sorting domain-containing protein [Bacillota bacterium]
MKRLSLPILLFLFWVIYLENSNAQWVQTKRPMEDSSSFKIYSLLAADSNLYMGANNSLYISTDKGESWNKTGYNQTNPARALAVKGKDIFTATGSNGVYLSHDSGISWNTSNGGLKDLSVSELVASGENVVGINYSGVILSKDNGLSWSIVMERGYFSYGMLTAGNRYVYLKDYSSGHSGNQVSKSYNNGANWYTVFSAAYSGGFDAVTAIGELNSYIFLGISNYISGETWNDIRRSTDDGKSWSIVKKDLLINEQIKTFAAFNTTVFAGTNIAVYASTDYGTTWNDISGELKGQDIEALVLNNKYLFARTNSNTIWKREISEFLTDVEEGRNNLPEGYLLLQNYPNPFNPSTTISYSLPFNSNVKLTVYNSLGEKVKELIDGFQKKGLTSVNFDASNLPSGVYYYSIWASATEGFSKEFHEVKKAVLIK